MLTPFVRNQVPHGSRTCRRVSGPKVMAQGRAGAGQKSGGVLQSIADVYFDIEINKHDMLQALRLFVSTVVYFNVGIMRVNHFSNTTCLTQVFFKSDE